MNYRVVHSDKIRSVVSLKHSNIIKKARNKDAIKMLYNNYRSIKLKILCMYNYEVPPYQRCYSIASKQDKQEYVTKNAAHCV